MSAIRKTAIHYICRYIKLLGVPLYGAATGVKTAVWLHTLYGDLPYVIRFLVVSPDIAIF